MSRTFTEEYLDEAFFAVDTPAHEFGEFEAFVALWHSKREAGRMPSWIDFNFEDFRGWHGWVCLFEVVEGVEFDLFARLWGSNIVRMLGFEMTGKHLRRRDPDDTDTFSGYEGDDMDFWEAIHRDGVIGLTDGRLQAGDGRYIRYRDIFLPLSSDGKSVDKLVSATQPRDPIFVGQS